MERQHNLTSLRARIVPERRMLSIRLVHLLTNAAIIGLWLWLYRPVFDYLAIIFSRDDFRTNQIVLLGIVVLIVIRMRKDFVRPRFDLLPQLHLPALALTLVGSALYLLLERFIDINTLSASFFGLASYGLLGLWMEPRTGKKGCLHRCCSSAHCHSANTCKRLLVTRCDCSPQPPYAMGYPWRA